MNRSCSLLLFLSLSAYAQTIIKGTVTDSDSEEPLQFCNVWIDGTSKGTSTDRHGRFTLYLAPGKYTIVASYIGYKTHRREITVGTMPLEFTIALQSMHIEMPEVTITPGDNPALRIIRLAIDAKEKRKEKLQNYRLTSHSKVVVDVFDAPNFSIGGGGRRGARISIGSGGGDTASVTDTAKGPLKAILETQTDAYWAKPDRYKEIVKARKQSAFIPAQANIIISSFFIIDFSSDELKLSDKSPVVGPISEAGLKSYYYRLIGTTEMDGKTIYMIRIKALDDNDPLLRGTLYIADETFALMMVDLELNEAAMPTFFKRLAFRQNFRLFEKEFWMPVDVVVNADVEVSLIITVKIGIDGFSVLQDYAINEPVNEEFFDRTRIKVLKEADERDSSYWAGNQLIPNTAEEIKAYEESDSVRQVMQEEQNRYGIFDFLTTGKTFVGEESRFTTPGVLSLYHFNRVEGHALAIPFSAWRPFDPIESLSLDAAYGFNDKRWKYRLQAGVRIVKSPSVTLSAESFDRTSFIDEEYGWLKMNTTISNLFFKYDFKDYYYTKGFSGDIRADILHLFPTTLFVARQSFMNARKTTDWSVFRTEWKYRENPAINEGSILSAGVRLSFDNRDFIDNAGEIRRFGRRDHTPVLDFEYNSADIEGERYDFRIVSAHLNGRFDFGRAGTTQYRLSGAFSDAKLPTQRVMNLPGSINYISENWRFLTLDFREFGGDKRMMIFIQHDFRDELFRWLNLPLLNSSGFGLLLHAKAGWTSMTAETRTLQTISISDARTPFAEIGFGINRILTFLRIDFAWRLNHFRQGRNFFIGISTPVTN